MMGSVLPIGRFAGLALLLGGCGSSGAPKSTESVAGTGTDTDPSTGTGNSTGTGTGTGANPGRDFSTDRSLFFGDSRCATADVLLCDGFESGSIDAALWTERGNPSVDGVHAARGSSALHLATVDNGLSTIEHTAIFPVANGAYWGRMFVWFDALPTAPDWAHWTIVGASGADLPGEIRVGGQYHSFQAQNLFGSGSDGGATGDWTFLDDDPSGTPAAVPAGEWICVEWLHDAQNHVSTFYWDATEHPSVATTADVHGGDQGAQYLLPQFSSVWIGWWLYQGGTTPGQFDTWIDEVAFDTERIGCVL